MLPNPWEEEQNTRQVLLNRSWHHSAQWCSLHTYCYQSNVYRGTNLEHSKKPAHLWKHLHPHTSSGKLEHANNADNTTSTPSINCHMPLLQSAMSHGSPRSASYWAHSNCKSHNLAKDMPVISWMNRRRKLGQPLEEHGGFAHLSVSNIYFKNTQNYTETGIALHCTTTNYKHHLTSHALILTKEGLALALGKNMWLDDINSSVITLGNPWIQQRLKTVLELGPPTVL